MSLAHIVLLLLTSAGAAIRRVRTTSERKSNATFLLPGQAFPGLEFATDDVVQAEDLNGYRYEGFERKESQGLPLSRYLA